MFASRRKGSHLLKIPWFATRRWRALVAVPALALVSCGTR
jgi:hypothetical protein